MIYFAYLLFLIIKTTLDIIHQCSTINRLRHIRNIRHHNIQNFIDILNVRNRGQRYPLDISLLSFFNYYNDLNIIKSL